MDGFFGAAAAYGYGSSELDGLGALMAAVAGFLMAFVAVFIVVVIVMAVAAWRVFAKAGEPGWKALVPFYNSYTMYYIAWDAGWFLLVLAAMVGSSVLRGILGAVGLGAVGGLVGAASGLFALAVGVVATHKLSRAFGHGIGFTLGLLLLPPVFWLILALGPSEYQGAQA